MNWKTYKVRGGCRLAMVVLLAGAFLVASYGRAMAQSNESASSSGLVGVWMVQVTLTDCATGNPLPGAPFSSLVTYHRGGTVTESAGSLAFAIGQRSTGHGTWKQDGTQTYLQKMVALILFTTQPNLPGAPGFNPALPVSPGFFAGWSTVTHTASLVDADHVTSYGTNEFYKANGELYRTGCSTATAMRFE